MKIAVIAGFYSEGMGYSENCLPKFLALAGHEVHVVASNLNVYANAPDYDTTYQSFLGPPEVPVGSTTNDVGVTVHRLPARMIGHHVWHAGIIAKIRELKPDVVHLMEIASIPAFMLAPMKPMLGYKMFAESHQHMSVLNPVLKTKGPSVGKLAYTLTRTLPTFLASCAVEKCYAISPDCAETARRYYGVPADKIVLQHLGSDTERFHPPESDADIADRLALREQLGFAENDIVAVYTGRFSSGKDPLLLAKAIARLRARGLPFRGLFVGAGPQHQEIAATEGCVIRSFMTHHDLARHYRASDIAVWPKQESMSMLDAGATGLPVVVCDTMGEPERVEGSGRMFREDDASALAQVLADLSDPVERQRLGAVGRAKMERSFSWSKIARELADDFSASLRP